jgi:hypothetical protein
VGGSDLVQPFVKEKHLYIAKWTEPKQWMLDNAGDLDRPDDLPPAQFTALFPSRCLHQKHNRPTHKTQQRQQEKALNPTA